MRELLFSLLLTTITFPIFGKVMDVQPVEITNCTIYHILKQEISKIKAPTSCDMRIYDSLGDTICTLNFDGTSDFVKDSSSHFFFQYGECTFFLHGNLAASFCRAPHNIPSQEMDVDDFEMIFSDYHPYLIRNDSAYNLIPHFEEYERNSLYFWSAKDFIKERYNLDSTEIITLFYCEDLSRFYDYIKDGELKKRLSSSLGIEGSIPNFPYRKRENNGQEVYLTFSRFAHNVFSAVLSFSTHDIFFVFKEEDDCFLTLEELTIMTK